MRHLLLLFITLALLMDTGIADAQGLPQAASALQSSNLLNPNVSVIGRFDALAGRKHLEPDAPQPRAFKLTEAEIGIQSVVDPYAKADFFVAVDGDGAVDLEEGYINWFSIPYDLAVKAGKFRSGFGKFNRTHSPETAFADRPLVHERFFGEEGLSGMGGSLNWLVPNPWSFMSLDAEVTTAPDETEVPAFISARKGDLLYVGRANAYHDITEAWNAILGGSFAYGPAGQDTNIVDASTHSLRSQLWGVDLTVRWKEPTRAIYRSLLWQTELLWCRKDLDAASATRSFGWFSHIDWQFARRWHAGGRWDYSQFVTDHSKHEEGVLAYGTFTPSESSLLSLQARQRRLAGGMTERLALFKITFNIGPHGAHPL